ncbi:MAG: GAF domain-containing protein [Candidatus Omnitrophica bacterium]|nr:GAF domain-containing protein [Candidatus Omnitrophota bacterium]
MNPFALSAYVTSLATTLIGLFVYLKRPASEVNRSFFIYSGTIALWALLTASHSIAGSEWLSLYCARLMHVAVALIPVLFFHFVLILLESENESRLRLILHTGYAMAVALGLGCVSGDLFVHRVRPKLGYQYFMDGGMFYPLLIAFFTLFSLIGLLLLLKAIRGSKGLRKVQLQYLFWGSLIGYGFGSSNFFPVYGVTVFPYPYGSFGITAYVLIMAYAVIRHRLLDINIAMTRTGIFILVYLVILGLPFGLGIWGRLWLQNFFGEWWWVFPQVVCAVTAGIGPFLYIGLQQKAEEALLKHQRRYQHTLLQASRGMTLVKDLDHLLKLTVYILTRTIRISHASVYIFNEREKAYQQRKSRLLVASSEILQFAEDAPLVSCLKGIHAPVIAEEIRLRASLEKEGSIAPLREALERLKAAVVVPSFIRDQMIGFLVLGEKRSGQIYTEDDLNTLSTLANQAALAFENCEFIKKVEQTQLQLFQAAKMADLGTMASGIGHQINNRLAVIKMAAESIVRAELAPILEVAGQTKNEKLRELAVKTRQSLERISASATKGGEVVRALLDFSHLSEGFQETSLPKALEQSIRLLEFKKELRDIDLQNLVPPDLPPIWGNFTQLEEIMINLLDNGYDAIKMKEEARERGELPKPPNSSKGRVTVSAQPLQRDGKSFIELTVKDTGIGMTPETQKEIFVPFFTLKATSIKGTGLGLYVIKQMVLAHQGELFFESEYGKGTTFRILFPTRKGNTP